MNQFIRIYLLPGAMLQSVIIAGGYGTGREVVEYFSGHGMAGGLYGLLVAALCLAVVFCLSLEIARRFRVYDYRQFFQVLLGRAWFIYEVLGAMLFMLVFAVIGSAAGNVLQSELGLPAIAGALLMLIGVTVIVFFGRELVTRLLTWWSVFLYAVFIAYLAIVFNRFGDAISASFDAPTEPGWALHGLQYVGYNMTAIPVILYCARAIETRRQAITAGIVGAAIAIVPGIMLHVSFGAFYPSILSEPLPIYTLFSALDIALLKIAYLVVLFGTFIETGAGNLQGVIERLDGWWQEREGVALSRWVHAGVAAVLMLLAGALSFVGIVNLIAEGYGTLAWGFILVYALPLMTIGIYRLLRDPGNRSAQLRGD